MTSKIKTLAQAIQTKLAALNDGATPTPLVYFDHVWVGMPKKVPMGDRCVAIIEAAKQPNYYYTTCAAQTQFDIDFNIFIMVKGGVENATLYLMEIVEVVQNAVITDQNISNTCIGSTVEDVTYVELDDQGRSIAKGANIVLRCRL